MIVPKTILDRIIIAFADDGTIRGASANDKSGYQDDATGQWVGATMPMPGRDIAAADLSTAAIDPTLAAQQATIANLTTRLATANTALQAAAAKDAQIADLQRQLSSVSAPSSSAADALLTNLNEVFATVPTEYQAQFANEYATVRVLIQAGQPALAAAVVEGVAVPDALTAIKAQILAALKA